MNKKIFAALASATMALSATGSLAVFAEDFDVVEENNNGNANAGVSTGVVLNSTNFPDKDFRDAIGAALGGKEDGAKLSKKDLETITSLTLTGAATPSNSIAPGTAVVTVQVKDSVKDLTGIQYLTKLQTLTVSKCAKLETADLSENAELQTVDFSANADSLETLVLPAGTNLNSVTVVATDNRAPITTLDLSQNKALNSVTVNNTEIASLDLSNNTFLTTIDVNNNFINTLNVTGTYNLTSLEANENHLYSIDLPTVANQMATLDLSGNLLQELTLPKLPKVTFFDVSDNQLKTIDVDQLTYTPATDITLDISNNHIGAINLKKFNGASTVTAGPQIIYIGKEYDELNLTDNFDDFNKGWVTEAVTPATVTYDEGVLSGIDGNGATYVYNTNGGTKDGSNAGFNMTVNVVPADILNRLYNPNSGEHFYTKDLEEKDVLVDLGWHDEGIGWTSPVDSTVPVFRLYNPNAGDHHYTKSSKERDVLVSVGWKYEGIGWYSFEGTSEVNPTGVTPDPIPVYREYNPNAKAAGAHNYTTNEAENDFLVSVGWLEEGIAWNAMK